MTAGTTARVTRATAGFDSTPSRTRSALLTIGVAVAAAIGCGGARDPGHDRRRRPARDRRRVANSSSRAASPAPSARRWRSRAANARWSSRSASANGARSMRRACAMPPPRSPGRRAATAAWRPRSAMSRTSTPRPPARRSSRASCSPAIAIGRSSTGPTEAPLTALTLVGRTGRTAGLEAGVAAGRITAEAVQIARDLCNTPATHLTATRMAEVAMVLGAESGLEVEVFDKDALVELGCGGLLGVNMGSDEPPRMIKLTYRRSVPTAGRDPDRPPRARRQGDHVRRRRHQPQAVRRDARRDEAGHVRRGRGPRLDDHAARARLPGRP